LFVCFWLRRDAFLALKPHCGAPLHLGGVVKNVPPTGARVQFGTPRVCPARRKRGEEKPLLPLIQNQFATCTFCRAVPRSWIRESASILRTKSGTKLSTKLHTKLRAAQSPPKPQNENGAPSKSTCAQMRWGCVGNSSRTTSRTTFRTSRPPLGSDLFSNFASTSVCRRVRSGKWWPSYPWREYSWVRTQLWARPGGNNNFPLDRVYAARLARNAPCSASFLDRPPVPTFVSLIRSSLFSLCVETLCACVLDSQCFVFQQELG